jgi:transposase InsO family protein
MRSMPEVLSSLRPPFAINQAHCPYMATTTLGLDIVGPLPTAQWNLKFTFVAVEYVTKWIEARTVSTITSKTAQKFFWQNIVCRFGVPSELTVDNDKQFDSQDFREFCCSIGTKVVFASMYHPQSNGVVERTNGKIFSAIKKRLLDDKKGKWADQLPKVVWALNTTECRATGFTPFCLMYGSEAMTPQDLKHRSPRTNKSVVPDVDEPTSKDFIDGDHVLALQALDKYQVQTKAWHDNTVVPREFNEGDLVLIRTTRTESQAKLEPKWEGSYIVKTKASPSAYRLATSFGEDLEHSWNIDSLRNFFV